MSNKPKKNRRGAVMNAITREDFSATHYMGCSQPSDYFYARLANKLYSSVKEELDNYEGLAPDTSKRLAITLACYVEDLVAGTGVWAAFSSIHQRKYGKKLPFYNVRGTLFGYEEDRPSMQAVQFLIWYELCNGKPGTIINPNNPGIQMMALTLMPDLAMAYEEAPETPARPELLPEDKAGVPLFFQIRQMCQWLCDGCYLTRIHDRNNVTDDFDKFIGNLIESTHNYDGEAKAYASEAFVPLNARIGPLAIPAYEWLAEILDLYHESGEEPFIPILKEIKSLPYQTFRYVSLNKDEAEIENVLGEKFTLSAATMPGEKFPSKVKAGDSAVMSIVRFGGKWSMNGLSLESLPPQMFEETRKKVLAEKKMQKENYNRLYKAFGRRRIGVCASYDEYLQIAFAGKVPEVCTDVEIPEDIRNADNLLYFLKDNGMVSLLPDWGDCVKTDGNPYYDPQEAAEEGRMLILDHRMTSSEMRDYLIKKKLLPDAALNSMISPEAGKELFQRNMRFINDFLDRDTMPFATNI